LKTIIDAYDSIDNECKTQRELSRDLSVPPWFLIAAAESASPGSDLAVRNGTPLAVATHGIPMGGPSIRSISKGYRTKEKKRHKLSLSRQDFQATGFLRQIPSVIP
jgi:hypothetical protein